MAWFMSDISETAPGVKMELFNILKAALLL